MDQEKVVTDYKRYREAVGLGCQIACARGGKFLASVKSPYECDDPLPLLASCVAAFYADEAVFVIESHARHVDADDATPITEDPTAESALLFVFSDRWGLREWRLCPYGTTDDGQVEWHDLLAAMTTPELGVVMELLDEVYALGDCRSESKYQIMMLGTNDYFAYIHRSVLEAS